LSKESFVDAVMKTTALSNEAAERIWKIAEAQNPGKIYASMAAIMADAEAVGKNKVNTQQGYKFRAADDVSDAIRPLMGKHGVFPTKKIIECKVLDRETRGGAMMCWVIMKCVWTFHATDGSSISTEAYGEGMDLLDKAHNKAETGSMKNALIQVFQLMGHEDSENELPPDSERPAQYEQRGGRVNRRQPQQRRGRQQRELPDGGEPTAAELAERHNLKTGDQVEPPTSGALPPAVPKKTVAEMAAETIADCKARNDMDMLKKTESRIRDRHRENKITQEELLELGTKISEAETAIKAAAGKS